MSATRAVAVKLACEGLLHIEQKKQRVDPHAWDRKGIIRLRLSPQ